jgi:DNA-binding MarR family transcriptional regulator
MATHQSVVASTATERDEVLECARVWVALKATYDRVSECLTGRLGESFGLGVSDFEVLVQLGSLAPRRLRLSDLHESVRLSQPALSRLAARLEQRGLVRRAAAPDDRRAVLLELTDRGDEVLRRAVPIHAACVRECLTSRLSETEQDALIASLTQV